MSDVVAIESVPMPLRWESSPVGWLYRSGALRIDAGPGTDLFAHPQSGATALNAPRLLARPGEDFMLAARVHVGFAAAYDAGALLIWVHDGLCAKLCFEYSPQAEPMIVSVVTRDHSDDANSFVLDDTAWLRIARIGSAYAFHASSDGLHWLFVRHFTLGASEAAEGCGGARSSAWNASSASRLGAWSFALSGSSQRSVDNFIGWRRRADGRAGAQF